MIKPLVLLVVCGSASATAAQTRAAQPTFVPGLYETESRNSAFPKQGAKSTTCLASADFDAFRRETIAQYASMPQFTKVCRLSEPKSLADGFVFAMDCGASKTIVSFRFSKDLVRSETETKIEARPEYSSAILTLSRRVGACAGRKPATGAPR